MKKIIKVWISVVITFILLTGCTVAENRVSSLNNSSAENRVSSLNNSSAENSLSNLNNSSLETDLDKYLQAVKYIKEKQYPQAMGVLREISDYKDSKNLMDQLLYIINGSSIANGIWLVGAIAQDGGVQVAYAGEDDNKYDAARKWKGVKSLCARGGDSIEGLVEGKIVTTSTVTKQELLNSKNAPTNAMAHVVESVLSWDNIKSFQTFYPQNALALTNDGRVLTAYSDYQDKAKELQKWKDLIAVADGRSYLVGIKKDGTVINKNFDYNGTINTSDWKNIVAVAADSSVIGLREDGTVVSTGLNENGEGNVSDWKDIIAISTSRYCTLGLKRDGTVVATGSNTFGQMDVQEWKDIVAISAGYYFSIGLKADGTMLIAGDCSSSGVKTPDITGMKGLYVPGIRVDE